MLDWDFAVSPPASSRLVIFQGSFKKLSIAIYGQLGESQVGRPVDVAPMTYPVITPRTLPPSIDIANLSDSSQTARSLLRANPANPSLRHVFHSLLCYVTTPEGPFDEWDESSGNPIERLLESDVIDAIELMQEAIQALRKPLPEIEESTATQFISLVNESLGENPDLQTCKLLFEILGYASLQSDSLVTAVLYGISTVTYLADPRLLQDDDIPKHIERWISHPLVARYLNEPDIQEYMLAGREQATSSENMARWEQIQSAIISWGDFHQAFDEYDEAMPERIPRVARWLRHSFSERHFGPVLLWRLWNQPNIVGFSSDEPAFRDYNNLLLGTHGSWDSLTTLLESFRATLKTYMGIAAVLSIVWWSRFPPDAIACRAISVLKLWVESPGIHEIVRSLVLMPIFHEALSELSVDVPLHKSGLYAQQLLESLSVSIEETEEPMPEAVPATPEPPQLSGHLEVMAAVLKQTKMDDITVKRISLASQRVLRQVKETPEEPWSIFTESHQSTSESFMLTQIEVLRRLKGYMDSHEIILDVGSLPALTSLLVAFANILETVSILLPYANIPTPTARSLIHSTTSIFISSEIILSRNRRQTQITEPSHTLRQACVQLFRTLVEFNDSEGIFQYPVADQVLPTVLNAWTEFDAADTIHVAVSQTAVLLDLLVPQSPHDDIRSDAQSFWVQQVVRNLPQIERLLSIISPRHWVTLVSHLVELDGTETNVGLGPWFALNELQALRTLVSRITLEAAPGKLAVMLRVADRSVALLVALFRDILRDNIIETIVRDITTMASFAHCLETIVDNHATSIATAELAALLAPYTILDEPRALRRLLATALLRGSRVASSPYSFWLAIPQLLVPHRTFATRDMDLEVFGTDIGLALANLCTKWVDEEQQAPEIWECAVRILEWLAELEDVATVRLHGLDQTTLETLRSQIEEHVPSSRLSAFDFARGLLTFSPDVPEDISTATSVITDTSILQTTTADIRAAMSHTRTETSRETTPQPGLSQIELLALASISPRAPTSPISPSAPLTLTKMYSHNEFRRLRQSPSARLNTSRPPSQHVDDWQPDAL
ncbi:hypothetical protein B0J17DRAFT_644405 [Rhizoctonia solani]|nr:hypothetical protein B0J17DRAFT_644405 [Rhizoctonia solani]